MKKILSHSLLTLYLLSIGGGDVACHDNILHKTDQTCNPHLKKLLKKYSTSVLGGALIGSSTGVGCRYTRKYIHWLPAWMIWIIIRHELLEIAQDELYTCNLMDRAEVAECSDLMTSIAWLADWLNYLS